MGHLSQARKTLAAGELYKRGARRDTVVSLTGILSSPKLTSIRAEIEDKIHYGSQNRSVDHLLQRSRLTHLHASSFINIYLELVGSQADIPEWQLLCEAFDTYYKVCDCTPLLDINEGFFLTQQYMSKTLLSTTCKECQGRFLYLYLDDRQNVSPGCPVCAILKMRYRAAFPKPKPAIVNDGLPRKRGRPAGSKNKPKPKNLVSVSVL
jgi:hypothetical protein